jgi:hypothetical protein
MGEKKNTYRLLVENQEGISPLGNQVPRSSNNNKINIEETRCSSLDLANLAQDRDQWRAFVKEVMNLQVPLSVWKFLSGFTTGGLSSSVQLC